MSLPYAESRRVYDDFREQFPQFKNVSEKEFAEVGNKYMPGEFDTLANPAPTDYASYQYTKLTNPWRIPEKIGSTAGAGLDYLDNMITRPEEPGRFWEDMGGGLGKTAIRSLVNFGAAAGGS